MTSMATCRAAHSGASIRRSNASSKCCTVIDRSRRSSCITSITSKWSRNRDNPCAGARPNSSAISSGSSDASASAMALRISGVESFNSSNVRCCICGMAFRTAVSQASVIRSTRDRMAAANSWNGRCVSCAVRGFICFFFAACKARAPDENRH
jgi:hypothetical protein